MKHDEAVANFWLDFPHVSFFRLYFSMVMCIMSEYVIVWHILTYIEILCSLYVFYMYLIYLCHVWDFRLCFQTLVRQKSSLGSRAPAPESRYLAENLANVRSIPCGVSRAEYPVRMPNWGKDGEEQYYPQVWYVTREEVRSQRFWGTLRHCHANQELEFKSRPLM